MNSTANVPKYWKHNSFTNILLYLKQLSLKKTMINLILNETQNPHDSAMNLCI